MQITINGQARSVEPDITVEALVASMKAGVCAVEVNRELVPKADRSSCMLREGDSVELVTLVGGG